MPEGSTHAEGRGRPRNARRTAAHQGRVRRQIGYGRPSLIARRPPYSFTYSLQLLFGSTSHFVDVWLVASLSSPGRSSTPQPTALACGSRLFRLLAATRTRWHAPLRA